MLILTRKLSESVIVGDNVKITVVEISKHQIKLGIDAPKSIAIHREEVFERIQEENKLSSTSNLIDLADLSKTDIKEDLFNTKSFLKKTKSSREKH